jgi:hypothetical protein
MKLWLLKQDENGGYDTYDSCVVAAETEEAARHIRPSCWSDNEDPWAKDCWQSWASSPENVKTTLLGEALPETPPGIILASFNAG